MLLITCFSFFLLLALLQWRIALFFFCLLLPSYLVRFSVFGIPSTALEAMLIILLGSWIFKERKQIFQHGRTIQNLYKEHRSICLATGLFFLAATISIFTAIEYTPALGEWKAFYIEPILFAIILFLEFKKDSENVTRSKSQSLNLYVQTCPKTIYILLPIVVLAGATSLLAIYQHFTGWMVPWDFWENRNTLRVTGWYGFPNGVGLFLAPIYPFALYSIISFFTNKKENTKRKALITDYSLLITSSLTLITIPFAILYAKSTGALIGLIAGMGILTLIWKKTRWLAITAGIVGLLGLILVPNTNPIKQELLAQDRSGQIRVQMWAESVELLTDHPITGAGLASYQTVVWPYRVDKWIEVFHHPHNIFLTVWVNLGILGLFAFLWICVWFFRVCLMQMYKGNIHLIPFLFASMVTWLVMGLADSPYIKNDWSIFFWVLVSLLLLETVKKQKK